MVTSLLENTVDFMDRCLKRWIEIYKRHTDYALWLSNGKENFITSWISKDDFLGGIEDELEIGKTYNIVAWRDNEHELVQNILMDLIQLVDIEYK